MSTEPAGEQHGPVIRVLDYVAARYEGDDGELRPVGERLVEFTLTELERLLGVLGGEGMSALVAYLRVLHTQDAPDGRPMLVVERFSATWLQEHAGLSRTRALNAQRALVASGLFAPLVSAAGVGARGHQRGQLNSTLVAVPGGAGGEAGTLRRRRSGPQAHISAVRETGQFGGVNVQVSPELHDTRTPGQEPGLHNPSSSEIRESGPDSRQAALLQSGVNGPPNVQVSPEVQPSPSSGSALTTSCKGLGVHSLLSTPGAGPGLLAGVWRPLLRADPGRGREVIYPVFNDIALGPRSQSLVQELGLDATPTARARVLTALLGDLTAGTLATRQVLDALRVNAHPDPLTPELVTERVVAGLVAGLGVPKVSAWGGWLFAATKPDWAPRQNATLSAFTAALSKVALSQAVQPAVAAAVGQGGAHTAPEGAGIVDAPAADLATRDADVSPQLSDEMVVRHLESALTMFPDFRVRATSHDHWARAVVQLYLSGGDPDERTG